MIDLATLAAMAPTQAVGRRFIGPPVPGGVPPDIPPPPPGDPPVGRRFIGPPVPGPVPYGDDGLTWPPPPPPIITPRRRWTAGQYGTVLGPGVIAGERVPEGVSWPPAAPPVVGTTSLGSITSVPLRDIVPRLEPPLPGREEVPLGRRPPPVTEINPQNTVLPKALPPPIVPNTPPGSPRSPLSVMMPVTGRPDMPYVPMLSRGPGGAAGPPDLAQLAAAARTYDPLWTEWWKKHLMAPDQGGAY